MLKRVGVLLRLYSNTMFPTKYVAYVSYPVLVYSFFSSFLPYLRAYYCIPRCLMYCSQINRIVSKMVYVYSINVRGLRIDRKRREVFRFLKRKAYDVISIQESPSSPEVERVWEQEWGWKCLYSHKIVYDIFCFECVEKMRLSTNMGCNLLNIRLNYFLKVMIDFICSGKKDI